MLWGMIPERSHPWLCGTHQKMLLVAVGNRCEAQRKRLGGKIREIDLSGDIAQARFFQRIIKALVVPVGQ